MTPEHRNACVRLGALAAGFAGWRAGGWWVGFDVALAAYCLLALLRDVAARLGRIR